MLAAGTTKFYNWAQEKTGSPRSTLWLILLFGFEIFLFMPLDALFLFFSLQNREKITRYIVLAAAASVVSGLIGFTIGHFLWDILGPYLVPHLISPALFANIVSHYQSHEAAAAFFGSLLPLPLKVLSLSAGFCHLKLLPYLSYLFAARLLRFGIIGALVNLWGDRVQAFLDKHHRSLLYAIGAKLALSGAFFWAIFT